MEWVYASSFVATGVFLRSLPTIMSHNFHHDLYQGLKSQCFKFLDCLNSNASIVIKELNSDSKRDRNEMYEVVKYYLSSKAKSSCRVVELVKLKNSNDETYLLPDGQSIVDTFSGIKVRWSAEIENNNNRNHKFSLTFHSKYRDYIQNAYLSHIQKEVETLRYRNRGRHLHVNDGGSNQWRKVPFQHPSKFKTLAVDPAVKQEIIEDLDKFVQRRVYYSRVGKTWKRGYLLYGPPGTGKTSLIAAIANYLQFDVYELELSVVGNNLELRRLLESTSNKSVIIVEDIDCSSDLWSGRRKEMARKKSKLTGHRGNVKRVGVDDLPETMLSLSGVLNFVDGMWSSCGEERLVIFTTNHKENLDPALLRPGRMDKHINLSYCEFPAFKILANNYLEIDDHHLMQEVQTILPTIQMTPADIAEIFLGCNDDRDLAMTKVVEEMKRRQPQALSTKEKKTRKRKAEADSRLSTKEKKTRKRKAES